jgi:WD40 repeat protein
MNNPYPVRTFKGNRERVNTVTFHPKLKQIASGSDDASICLWNIEDNRFSFKLVGHKAPVQEIHFSPSGGILASASKDNTIKVWNNKYDGSFSTLRHHLGGVNTVQFFNEGANLISGSDDKTVVVWSYNDQKVITKLEGHLRAVNSVRVSHDNKVCISGSDDGLVKLWNIERNTDLSTFNESRCIYGVRLNPESNCIATCGEDAFIRLHDIRSRFEIKTFKDHQGASNCVEFHPYEPYLISGGEDAKVRLFDLRKFAVVKSINANHIGTNSVCFSRHGDYFGCGGDDKMVMIWKSNITDVQREHISQANEQIGVAEVETHLHPKSHLDGSNYINYIKKVTNVKSANGKPIYSKKHPEFSPSKLGQKDSSQDGKIKYVISEDLGHKLDKINANLDMVAKTVQILTQRITNNEKAVTGVIEYMSQKYGSTIESEISRDKK